MPLDEEEFEKKCKRAGGRVEENVCEVSYHAFNTLSKGQKEVVGLIEGREVRLIWDTSQDNPTWKKQAVEAYRKEKQVQDFRVGQVVETEEGVGVIRQVEGTLKPLYHVDLNVGKTLVLPATDLKEITFSVSWNEFGVPFFKRKE